MIRGREFHRIASGCLRGLSCISPLGNQKGKHIILFSIQKEMCVQSYLLKIKIMQKCKENFFLNH